MIRMLVGLTEWIRCRGIINFHYHCIDIRTRIMIRSRLWDPSGLRASVGEQLNVSAIQVQIQTDLSLKSCRGNTAHKADRHITAERHQRKSSCAKFQRVL